MNNSNKKIIKVATFNLLNLVLPERNYYDNQKYTQQEYDKKIDWIARMLQEMNADVVGFQEVFDKEALEDAVKKSGIYKNYEIVIGTQVADLPRVALLSRFPIKKSEVFENFPQDSIIEVEAEEGGEKILLPFKKFSRPVLKVDVEVHPGFTIFFYVVHLKSKRPTLFENESRDNPIHSAKAKSRSLFLRAAESTALRTLLMNTLYKKNLPVIVMGDVNDSGLSVTSQLISGEVPHRKLPQDIKRGLWDVLLYHVKDIQSRRSYGDFYYTHIHNGHYESLDQIMVSEELVGENPNAFGKIGYVKTFNDHLIDRTLTDEKPRKWQSDHGLVVTTIELLLDKIEKVFKPAEE